MGNQLEIKKEKKTKMARLDKTQDVAKFSASNQRKKTPEKVK